MSSIRMVLSALILGAAAGGAVAGATTANLPKTTDVPKMTCGEFLALDGSAQARAVVWLEGYSAGKLRREVGEVEVDRDMTPVIELCKQSPQQVFWDTVRDRLPDGKTTLKPMQMSCQEFVDLDARIQPVVAYSLHGYKSAIIATEMPAGRVDLERNMDVMLLECKRAPDESLWVRVRKHF